VSTPTHEPDLHPWWDRLDPDHRRTLIRHAYTPLPEHLAAVVLASRTDVELLVADHLGVDTRWYLSRDTAAFVTGLTRHQHLA
jgi:hypothetical protein